MKNVLKGMLLLLVAVGMLPYSAHADTIVKPHDFKAGTPADADQVNANFDTLYDQVNKVGAAVNVDGANNIGIGTVTPAAKLDVKASTIPIDSYGPWLNYDPYLEPCEHCSDTCNGNHSSEFTCPGGQTISCEDIRNDTGDELEYRIVECQTPQKAASITGDVALTGVVTGTSFVGDGARLTNITATAININCPENFVLKKTPTGWQCTALCQNGDYVSCYTGPPGTKDVGDCVGGIRTCSNWVYGTCEGQTLPVAEACNGIDDDCNGVMDDGQDGAVGCNQYYVDQDLDSYGDVNDSGVCLCAQPSGYASNNTDCRDNDYEVKPYGDFHDTSIIVRAGQPVDWDYNCDGVWEKEYPALWVSCPDGVYNCASGGWINQIPACGESAEFQPCGGSWSSGNPWTCWEVNTIQKIQRCR